jgi:hypothetical protein
MGLTFGGDFRMFILAYEYKGSDGERRIMGEWMIACNPSYSGGTDQEDHG